MKKYPFAALLLIIPLFISSQVIKKEDINADNLYVQRHYDRIF